MNNKIIVSLIIGVILANISLSSSAQVNPHGAIYFQNQYLANPAMAGFTKGLNLNLGYKNEWNASEGTPINQFFSLETSITKNLGFGVSLLKDEAGFFMRNKLTASLAYHLPFSDPTEHLSFGISGIGFNNRISNKDIIANQNDPIIVDFQNQEAKFDADFGLTYSKKKFTFQGAVYQLNNLIKNEGNIPNEYGLFYVALDYKWGNKNLNINPKLALRGIRGYQDVFDFGAEAAILNNKVKLTGLYHTDQSTTAGISYLFYDKFQVMTMYHTASNKYSYNTGNIFELALNLKLFGAKE